MPYKHFSNTTSGWEISTDPVAPPNKMWRAVHPLHGERFFASHDEILPFTVNTVRDEFTKLMEGGKPARRDQVSADKEPTLADLVIREWSKPKYRRYDTDRWVPRTIALARKFVLDKSMSEFMADLACSWLPPRSETNKRKLARAHSILESYRVVARLPHPVMWIEYDMAAWKARSDYLRGVPASKNPLRKKSGWILVQHPKVETSAMAIVVDATCVNARGEVVDTPMCCALGVAWSTSDELTPWRRNDITGELGRDAELAAGLKGFQCPQCTLAMAPWTTRKTAGDFMTKGRIEKEYREQAGVLRNVWSLLAAMNDIPMTRKLVKPTSGHMAGGSYRRFVDHTVISLNLPKRTTMPVLAKRVLRATRRRAHMVRGHFRRHWMFPLNPLCDHQLEPIDNTHMLECKLCEGRKMWITEHQVGDASLGWVTHDYAVHHKRG